ncbi:putative C6 transcription factor, partial [Xylogone sp. PMI_703]
MPRRQVRPEDRQRVYQACLSCKAVKKRCDSQFPCTPCIKRDRASSCTYPGPTDRRRRCVPHYGIRNPPRSQSRTAMNESENPLSSDREPSEVTVTMANESTPLSSTSVAQATSARMLINSKGERVYIGETASLSFLEFLRRSIRQYMGPSLFTQNSRRKFMLEADPCTSSTEEFEIDLNHLQVLVDCYFSATSGLLDLYTREEISMLLARKNNASNDEAAALSLIIAIGGQCRGIDPVDRQYAARYFLDGQKAAFEGMLQDPSLNMIRIFLLMAFYMFGACRRNAGTMYIGVASKAASTLGLHVADQYQIFDKEQQNVRLRIWKSLCNLNVTVTSILGRIEGSYLRLTSFVDLPSTSDSNDGTQQVVAHAVFGACSITQDIVQYLCKSRNVDINSASQFLKQLSEWKERLPDEVRRFSRSSELLITPADQALAIGNVHVSCVYYFAVILITRPFLISHLMMVLHRRDERNPATGEEHPEISDIYRFAQVCIDAAMYMAQTCHDAIKSGIFVGNMCLIKAWVFAAGLVLGFSIFVEGELRCDMEEAFASSCAVLKTLAKLSPQADHYHDLLTQLSDAISNYRRQLAVTRRRSNEQYVSQILNLNVTPTSDS